MAPSAAKKRKANKPDKAAPASDVVSGTPVTTGKKISKQQVKAVQAARQKKTEFTTQLAHALREVMCKPKLYTNEFFWPLREFCEYRDNHRVDFAGVSGETPPPAPKAGGEATSHLSSFLGLSRQSPLTTTP